MALALLALRSISDTNMTAAGSGDHRGHRKSIDGEFRRPIESGARPWVSSGRARSALPCRRGGRHGASRRRSGSSASRHCPRQAERENTEKAVRPARVRRRTGIAHSLRGRVRRRAERAPALGVDPQHGEEQQALETELVELGRMARLGAGLRKHHRPGHVGHAPKARR